MNLTSIPLRFSQQVILADKRTARAAWTRNESNNGGAGSRIETVRVNGGFARLGLAHPLIGARDGVSRR